jgi:hypothetical protein
MDLRKKDDTEILKRKQYIAVAGELALEDSMDLS